MQEDEAGATQVGEDLAMQRENPLQGDLPRFRGSRKAAGGKRKAPSC